MLSDSWKYKFDTLQIFPKKIYEHWLSDQRDLVIWEIFQISIQYILWVVPKIKLSQDFNSYAKLSSCLAVENFNLRFPGMFLKCKLSSQLRFQEYSQIDSMNSQQFFPYSRFQIICIPFRKYPFQFYKTDVNFQKLLW